MIKEDIDYSVYLVTDSRDKTEEEFLAIIEEAIKGGTSIVQLREKTASTKDFYELALKVKEITSRHDVPLLINDRIDIALAIDSEGVLIGQDDMPADIARAIIGDEKNDRGNEHEIDVDEIFAGHIDFIISEIGK